MAVADAGQPQLAADYLGKAAHWANAYITGPRRRRHVEPVRRAGSPTTTCTGRSKTRATRPAWRSRGGLLADMKKALDGRSRRPRPTYSASPWDVWDTTSHGRGCR